VRHLDSGKKLSFCKICPTKILAQIKKHNAIFKIAVILKNCKIIFQFFTIWVSSLYNLWPKIKILKNVLFETKPFWWIDFFAQFFKKIALKKSRWRPISNFSSKIDRTKNFTSEKSVFAVL
jgi:hypothetical protein